MQFLPLNVNRLFRLASLPKCQPRVQRGGRVVSSEVSVPLEQKLAIVSNQVRLLGARLHMCQFRLPSVVGTVKRKKALLSPESH